jgi:hypothetical protein
MTTPTPAPTDRTGVLHWQRAEVKHDAALSCLVVDVPLTADAEPTGPDAVAEWIPRIAQVTFARFGRTYELLAVGWRGGRNYTALFTVTPAAEA